MSRLLPSGGLQPAADRRTDGRNRMSALAGHRDLMTTQRYMHLSVATIDHAIRLLEAPKSALAHGDILETGEVEKTNLNG